MNLLFYFCFLTNSLSFRLGEHSSLGWASSHRWKMIEMCMCVCVCVCVYVRWMTSSDQRESTDALIASALIWAESRRAHLAWSCRTKPVLQSVVRAGGKQHFDGTVQERTHTHTHTDTHWGVRSSMSKPGGFQSRSTNNHREEQSVTEHQSTHTHTHTHTASNAIFQQSF